jgi:hypothetical protein
MSLAVVLAVGIGVIGGIVLTALAVWGVRAIGRESGTVEQPEQPAELVLPGGIIYKIDPKNLAIAEARFNEILLHLPR